MNRSVRPDDAAEAADSRARTVVVPTATTRRARWQAAIVAAGTEKRSECMTWSSRAPSTGRNVSRPTASSTVAISTPAARHFSSRSTSRCSPAVGAATEPGRAAYTVW